MTYACLYVTLNFMLSLFTQLSIRSPKLTGTFDVLMQIYALFCLGFFFNQWKESLLLYIHNRFIVPALRSEKLKLAYVMQTTLKKHKHPDNLVQVEQQLLQLGGKDPKDPDVADQIQDLKREIHDIMLYNARVVPFCCSKNSCAARFNNQKFEKAVNFQKYMKDAIYLVFTIQVITSSVDLVFFQEFKNEAEYPDYNFSSLFWIDVAQVCIGMLNIYLILIFARFSKKVFRKHEPFNNVSLLAFLVFVISIQNNISTWVFDLTLRSLLKDPMNLLIVVKTVLSIELLFICIPIRHNFSLETIESL